MARKWRRKNKCSRALTLVFALMLASITACQSPGSAPGPTPPAAVPAGTAAALPETPGVPASPTPASVAPAQTSAAAAPIALTWWTPDFISLQAGGKSGSLLAEYQRGFEAVQAGKVSINPIVKARYGRGGLLDLIRSAQPVAPGILPDLVTLDIAEVPLAASAGLLQPLDTLLSPSTIGDLYPFAREAGQFEGRLLAVPLVADIEHIVYSQERVKVPPVAWADLYTGNVTYLFPAASPESSPDGGAVGGVHGAFVGQYLSAGGAIDGQTRGVVLQEGALQRLFLLYGQAKAAGVFPATLLETASLEDCWTAYSEGRVAIANVSARRYLASRDTLKNTGYGAPPGWNGPAVPVASGWAVAILTTDPVRQRAAAAWIDWLTSTDRLSAWTQAAGWLPATQRAWAGWGSSAYYEFLQGQLAVAVPRPTGLSDPEAVAQLQKGIDAVLREDATPADAARMVLTPEAR